MPVASFEQLLLRQATHEAQNRLVFLHVPKAGGQSVNVLIAQNNYRQINIGAEAAVESPGVQHFFSGHIGLGHELFAGLDDRPFSAITMLRDPVARVLSNYNFSRRHPNAPWHEELIGDDMSFLDHVEATLVQLGPQYAHFATTSAAKPWECLENLTHRISFFGLTERFREFAIMFGLLFGVSNIMHLVPNNRTTALPDNGVLLKTDLTLDERDALSRLLADDVWFYRKAQELYAERMDTPGLRQLVARADQLIQSAEAAAYLLRNLEHCSDTAQAAFARKKDQKVRDEVQARLRRLAPNSSVSLTDAWRPDSLPGTALRKRAS